MSTFSRFRGTQRLAASEASKLVLQILRESPETRSHDRDALAALVSRVAESGLAAPGAEDPAGDGYRQVLALLAGVLLRLAGASDTAIRNTLNGTRAAQLESLVDAILKRMAQLAERGEPVARLEASPGPEPAPGPDTSDSPASMVGLRMPDPSESQAVENPAMEYLRGKLDDTLRRVVRNVSRPNHSGSDSGGGDPTEQIAAPEHDVFEGSGRPTVATPAHGHDAAPAAHRLEIARGVTVQIDANRLERYREPSQRAELIRAFAVAFERLLK